jgi:hypothetical protein
MPEDRWSTYVAYRLACVRHRIQETERLMRPPTPEEILCLHEVLRRLKEQEVVLDHILATVSPRVSDP